MQCPFCRQETQNTQTCDNCGAQLSGANTAQANNNVQQNQPYQQSQPYQTQPMPPQKTKKPFYKKWWFWVIVAVVVVVAIANGVSSKNGNSGDNTATTQETMTTADNNESKATEEATEKPTEKPTVKPTEDPKKAEQAFKDSCTTIDYKTLARNPDKYKGNNYKFTGQVIQVLDSDSWFDNSTTLRVNITAEDNEFAEGGKLWSDTIVCSVNIPNGADRILDNDIITFWGTCDGLFSYESIVKQKISLPKIDIKYYQVDR